MLPPLAKAIAVFGTASDVGKSVVAAALCRHLSDRGHRVAPFKAQNMSNNSGVTLDGKEMGRAQIVQAHCARTEPHVDMNPVLLKPSSHRTSQVIVLGEVRETRSAGPPVEGAVSTRRVALEALERLRRRFDTLVIEGAGSCAEVNLRPYDFVNFPTAHAANAAVLLVADIDRGGVFAQVVGTLDLLPPEDRARVAGVVVNRFRGDASLFDDGRAWLEERTGLPVLGVLPHLPDLDVEAEDAVSLDYGARPAPKARDDRTAWIAVLRLPHVSNFTDFDPLLRSPQVTLHFLESPRDLDDYALVVLPGTKAVRSDLDWLRGTGWAKHLLAYADGGGRIAGICGGYQMLGARVRDPMGVEGPAGDSEGLGLLSVVTTFARDKVLRCVRGRWLATDSPIEGFEIHMGTTDRGSTPPTAELVAETTTPDRERATPYPEGARSADGRIWGTYIHGLFASTPFRDALLVSLGVPSDASTTDVRRDASYDRLVAHFRQHVDVQAIERLVSAPP